MLRSCDDEKEQKRLAEEAARKRAALHPRRPSKAQGGPLTPQGRPVVLPGGRRWRNERDAFNEDFIAEIISSQAELIAGNALGYYIYFNITCVVVARIRSPRDHTNPFSYSI